jgi:hypothetical protein
VEDKPILALTSQNLQIANGAAGPGSASEQHGLVTMLLGAWMKEMLHVK